MIFYTLIFVGVAVLAVVAGMTYMTRNRHRLADEESHSSAHGPDRSETKARRKQSARARRKRHQ